MKSADLLYLIIIAVILSGCKKEMYVEPKDEDMNGRYSKIFMGSSPAGATIYVNGKTTGLLTPDTVKWLEPGDYRITLKKQYYNDTTLNINLVTGKISAGYVDYSQDSKMLGSITCSTSPSGTKIYLNNVFTGNVTPARLTRLLPGKYSVKYEYPEYRKDSMVVTVKSSSSNECFIKLDDTLDVVSYNMANSGLPSNNITCAAEDKDGNMWFGTAADGILKFDGNKFHRFTSENTAAVSSNIVLRVVRDKENNIWFGLSNGIVKYDGVNWTNFQTNMVSSLKVTKDNEIIATMYRGGLFRYKNGQITRIYSSPSGLSNSDVISACLDNAGALWVGINGGNVDVFNGLGWKHYLSESDGIPYRNNISFECDQNGNFYGLFHCDFEMPTVPFRFAKYNGSGWEVLLNSQAQYHFYNIYIDPKNGAWFSQFTTYYYGIIYRYKDGKIASLSDIIHSDIRKFKSVYALPYISGVDTYVDSRGNLWVVDCFRGIVKIKNGRWYN